MSGTVRFVCADTRAAWVVIVAFRANAAVPSGVEVQVAIVTLCPVPLVSTRTITTAGSVVPCNVDSVIGAVCLHGASQVARRVRVACANTGIAVFARIVLRGTN